MDKCKDNKLVCIYFVDSLAGACFAHSETVQYTSYKDNLVLEFIYNNNESNAIWVQYMAGKKHKYTFIKKKNPFKIVIHTFFFHSLKITFKHFLNWAWFQPL